MREGLMARPQGQQAQAPAPMPAGGDSDVDSYLDGGEASPEEQKQYDTIMQVAMRMMHSKQSRDAVFNKLKSDPKNMGPNIGEMTYQIFAVTAQKMEKGGMTLSDSVLMEVAEDIAAELVQMAVLAKLIPDDEEAIGAVMSQALDVAASRYGNDARNGGRVDPNAAKGHLQEMGAMAQSHFSKKPMAAAMEEKA